MQQLSLNSADIPLKRFTDRHELIFQFAEYLHHDNPNPNQILFFYGDSGNGKSLLLRFLKEKCCKRFQPASWENIKNHPAGFGRTNKITNWVTPGNFQPLPSALVDFQFPQSQRVFDGLLSLREQLVTQFKALGYKLSFPLYDFACYCYKKREQKGQSSEPVLKNIDPTGVLLIGAIFNLIYLNTVGVWVTPIGHALTLIKRYVTPQKIRRYFGGRGLSVENFQKIESLPQNELLLSLPSLFAEDLKVALESDNLPKKLVLFFDSHGAFFKTIGDNKKYIFFTQDEWLRCLLLKLLNLPQLVVVVAGQKRARWDQARYSQITINKIKYAQVVGFTKADAFDYLLRVGIKNHQQFQEELIDCISLSEDSVQPLMLAFCGDILKLLQHKTQLQHNYSFNIQQNFNLRVAIVFEALLKEFALDFQNAVYVLGACRYFNEDLYHTLGANLNFNPNNEILNSLLSCSFVCEVKHQEQIYYCFHSSVQDLILKMRNNLTQCAHKFLDKYYHYKGDITNSFFHLHWQDSSQMIEQFVEIYEDATHRKDNTLCQLLIEIKKEIGF